MNQLGPKIIGKIELPKPLINTTHICVCCGKSTGNLYNRHGVIAHDECLMAEEAQYWEEQANWLNMVKDQSL